MPLHICELGFDPLTGFRTVVPAITTVTLSYPDSVAYLQYTLTLVKSPRAVKTTPPVVEFLPQLAGENLKPP